MDEWKRWEKILEHQCEIIGDHTHRMKVPGGWIVRSVFLNKVGTTANGSMCFVPDNTMEVFAIHIKEAFNQGYEQGKKEALENANNTASPV